MAAVCCRRAAPASQCDRSVKLSEKGRVHVARALNLLPLPALESGAMWQRRVTAAQCRRPSVRQFRSSSQRPSVPGHVHRSRRRRRCRHRRGRCGWHRTVPGRSSRRGGWPCTSDCRAGGFAFVELLADAGLDKAVVAGHLCGEAGRIDSGLPGEILDRISLDQEAGFQPLLDRLGAGHVGAIGLVAHGAIVEDRKKPGPHSSGAAPHPVRRHCRRRPDRIPLRA